MSSGIIDNNNVYHNRRTIRLKDYDYAKAGAYYITICTDERENKFGDIIDGAMKLNELGKITDSCWNAICERFPNVELDEYVIMPNHVHGIIVITENKPVGAGLAPAQCDKNNPALCDKNNRATDNNDRATARVAPTVGNVDKYIDENAIKTTARVAPTVGNIVGAFKSIAANECLKLFKKIDKRMGKIWQRNYYEHIIHDNDELNRIREYIIQNPAKWEDDEYNLKK